MVRALLDGSKTQTRRVVKPQPEHPHFAKHHMLATDDEGIDLYLQSSSLGKAIRCPYGPAGGNLWVRETFGDHDRNILRVYDTLYRADTDEYGLIAYDETDDCSLYVEHIHWKPSIHMPRSASRITLEITGVRVERLQDISEADAMDEGITHSTLNDPRVEYQWLWESINGPGAWDANPWVWVIEFKRVTS